MVVRQTATRLLAHQHLLRRNAPLVARGSSARFISGSCLSYLFLITRLTRSALDAWDAIWDTRGCCLLSHVGPPAIRVRAVLSKRAFRIVRLVLGLIWKTRCNHQVCRETQR